MTGFLVYDAFTDTAFGGNQLGVIPDATKLPEYQLQAIAREFNFSETTFVYPPADPANTARVRIFTPSSELPFAGHPVIGTAIALSDMGRASDEMVLELGVGPLPVRISNGKATFETRVPLETSPGPDLETSAALVGLKASELQTDTHRPINAGVGLSFLMLEVRDLGVLAKAAPETSVFKACAGDASIRMGVFVYVRNHDQIQARMFAPLGGIPEDPATGSAAAALSGLLGKLSGKSLTLRIAQGVEMGRPSLIEAEVDVENGTPVAIRIGGSAVRTMAGHLTM